MMIRHESCPKCRGNILVNHRAYETTIRCMKCDFHRILPVPSRNSSSSRVDDSDLRNQ